MPAAPRDLSIFTRRGKIRKRAREVCEECQRKRIGCSASRTGVPCDGCQDHPEACRLVQSERRVQGAGWGGSDSPTMRSPNDVPTSRTMRQRSTSAESLEDSNNLYAQILDESTEPMPAGPSTSGSAPQVVYLGETFNLTHLLYTTNPHPRHTSHAYHRQTGTIRSNPPTHRVSDETLDILTRQRAFQLPPQDVIFDLFKAYFAYAYPHNPILSRTHFAKSYANPTSPPSFLLLQSVLFAAVGHCDSSIITRAGFESRYAARLELFRRAKALYDADYETDKVTLVQSLFLMSAWWNSPTDQKDTWHWLGAAIGLAVTMGMHRSTTGSILGEHDQRLWRRIWWALFTEDKHASAALGRPVHTRLRHCDVEPLSESDFIEDPLSPMEMAIFGSPRREHTLYLIHLSELSKIVERIIDSSSTRHNGPAIDRMMALRECQAALSAWSTDLPLDFAASSGLWTRMLLAAHSWFRILTYRLMGMVPLSVLGSDEASERTASHADAVEATNTITRIVEQTLSQDEILHCQIHIIPAMFAAMGIHAIDIYDGRNNSLKEQLGYVKLRMCMIALREIRGVWPLSGWIFLLFTRIVNRIRDRDREYMAIPESATKTTAQEIQDEIPLFEPSATFTESRPIEQQDQLWNATATQNALSGLLTMPLDFSADWADVLAMDDMFDYDAGFTSYNI